MLSGAELRLIQGCARGRFGLYLRLVDGHRFFDVVAVPDGITWLLKITSERGAHFDGAIDGDRVEGQLCGVVNWAKKQLAMGAPS